MKIRQFTRPARLLRHFEMGFIAGVNRDSERDHLIVRVRRQNILDKDGSLLRDSS
jgi:hypothetical protein